jgi:hypothetical protein
MDFFMSDSGRNREWIGRKVMERIQKINEEIAKHKEAILKLQEEYQLNQAIVNELLNKELSSEGNKEFSIEFQYHAHTPSKPLQQEFMTYLVNT